MTSHTQQTIEPRLAPESLAGFFTALQKSGASTINATLTLLALARNPEGMRSSEIARTIRATSQTTQGVLVKLRSRRLVKRAFKGRVTLWALSSTGSNLITKHTLTQTEQ
jgi:DNA-binding IclR family transcriptional regulator